MKISFENDSGETKSLDTEVLRTLFDKAGSSYAQEQSESGAELAREGLIMTISATGCWGAYDEKFSRSVVAYERLGYHANTKELLDGFVKAGGTVKFYGFLGIRGKISGWTE